MPNRIKRNDKKSTTFARSGKDSNKIEPTSQELYDDPKANKVERLYIDKFGNLLSDKPSELLIVLPQPAYGLFD